MNRPPSLLPDETQETRRAPGRRAGAGLAMWLVLLLLTFTLASLTIILLYRPDVIGLALAEDVESTRAALQQQGEANAATSAALAQTAEYFMGESFNQESTRAALDNREAVLQQEATQSALDIIATETNIALSNAQQATEAAIDFENTQVAFDRLATQAELAYQGTQAALNREATAAVLGFATRAPSGEDLLSQTPPPTLTAAPLFEDTFAEGVISAVWQVDSVADWSLNTVGLLQALRTGAYLLTQLNSLQDYRFEVSLIPVQGANAAADYYLLLNVPSDASAAGGLALRLSYNGDRLTAAGLYRLTRAQITQDMGLYMHNLDAIQAVQVNAGSVTELAVRAEVRDGRVVVVVNDALLLDVMLDSVPPAGAVGLQVPAGTQLQRVNLTP
ncbi:MAG: hypothetical protein OHK0046_20900 [Anaerolineae bacterium]